MAETPIPDETTARAIAKDLAQRGLSREAIITELVNRGVNRGIAVFIVNQNLEMPSSGQPRAGVNDMLIGGLIFTIGACVTAFTYLAANNFGGSKYLIAHGAIIVGAIQFIRGLVVYSRK